MMKRLSWLLLFLLLPVIARAEELGITVTDPVVGFSENTIAVTAPYDGQLTLRIQDDWNIYRTLAATVTAGENSLVWDGLGENEQRLPTGKSILSATLTSPDGSMIEAEISVTVQKPRQAVLFALSSADTLDLSGENDWSVEVKLVRSGKLTVAFYRADNLDEPLEIRRKTISTARVFQYAWDGKLNGEQVQPGDYVLRFYAEETPAYARDVRVTVREKAPDELITLTESFLPERGMSDEDIWRIMMQPSIVADGKKTAAVQLRSEAGEKAGEIVGTVHALSQGLKVLAIRADGYMKVGAWRQEDGAYVEGYLPSDKVKLLKPRAEYGLLLDKVTQTLTLYHEGALIAALPVSTGLVRENKLTYETPAGSYLLQERMADFNAKGFSYTSAIRYDGNRSLCQVGYRKEDGQPNDADQALMLGMKASTGNIRLPSELYQGINAYWLWTHLPQGTRLIILDDEEQRVWEAQAVSGNLENAVPTSAPMLSPTETEITLTLGGDAVLGTRERWQNSDIAFPAYLAQNGLDYPFSGLQELFATDDMTLVNLECVLKSDKSGEDTGKEFRFRGLPEYAEILNVSSIEQVNIANNHYVDYGRAGRDATRQALEDAGVPYSGYGYTYVWEIDGHRIGFGGCRETAYKADRDVIRRDVATLRRAGCEVILYSCHWGNEYHAAHNDLQEEMAREAMLAGVDLIIGTHPHVVQGLGTAGNTVVLWSLGNLMFGGTHDMQTFDATLARIRLRFDGESYVGCTVSYVPILTSSAAPANDFHPVIAEGEDKTRILEKIQADTPFPLADEMYFPANP